MGELTRKRVILDPMAFSTGNRTRTPGLHLTDIIKDILLTIGIDRSKGHPFGEEELSGFQLQGYLWEEVFTNELRGRLLDARSGEPVILGDYTRMGEIAVRMDGSEAFPIDPDDDRRPEEFPLGWIIMTPDAVRNDLPAGAEMKWTTKSALMRPELDKPEWIYQAKGVLKGLSTLYCFQFRRFEWHVQFPCGEYWVELANGRMQPRGTGVIYEQWEKDFEPSEIEDFWGMLTQHVLDRVEENPEHPWSAYL